MSLLEEKKRKKERINEKLVKLNFNASNNKKYKVETIQYSAVYASKA